MTIYSSTKINQLLKKWPRGALGTSGWLENQLISASLRESYVKNEWFKKISYGAYARADDKVTWEGGIHAIQSQLEQPIHVAAKTALELQGYAHFVPMGTRKHVYLFGETGIRLPTWFIKYHWGVNIHYISSNLFQRQSQLGITTKSMGSFEINISSPERAILEELYLVSRKQLFEDAALLLEGLPNLRTDLMQSLLESCNSIKVKRLIMFLGEYYHHPWAKGINCDKIGFGKGKRVIEKKGCLNVKYQITVPQSFAEDDAI